MSDFLIYWKNFAKDREAYGYSEAAPLFDWRTNSEWLSRELLPETRLWFVANGTACGATEPTKAYLVNVFRVESVKQNAGDDPSYGREEFKYTVWADRSRCLWIDPPLALDEIVRPPGHEAGAHIGQLLQRPRQLDDDTVVRLEELVRNRGLEPV